MSVAMMPKWARASTSPRKGCCRYTHDSSYMDAKGAYGPLLIEGRRGGGGNGSRRPEGGEETDKGSDWTLKI